MKSIHKPYALKTKKMIMCKNCRQFKSCNVIHNNCHMRLSKISSFPAVFPAGIQSDKDIHFEMLLLHVYLRVALNRPFLFIFRKQQRK